MNEEETVAIVNEFDKVISHKRRGELTDNDCWRGVSIWVENDQGQVLIQQRSMTKKNSPGKWSPAADGTVPRDISYDETAAKELEEEIGLRNVTLKKQNKLYRKYEFGWRQMQGYTAVCNWRIDKFQLQADEVMQIEWVDKQEVLDEISGKTPHTRLWPSSCLYWVELFNLA